MLDECNRKILEYGDQDLYVIFYSSWCEYSKKALDLLRDNNLSYKAYSIESIKGGMERLLKLLKNNKEETYSEFDPNYKTRPIIFYKGKFIGGYTELVKYIKYNV